MKGENWLCSSGISLEETPLWHEILSIAFFQLSPKLWLRERCLVVSPENWWLCYSCVQAWCSMHWDYLLLQSVFKLTLGCFITFYIFFKAHPFFFLLGVKINWSITYSVSVFEWITVNSLCLLIKRKPENSCIQLANQLANQWKFPQ